MIFVDGYYIEKLKIKTLNLGEFTEFVAILEPTQERFINGIVIYLN